MPTLDAQRHLPPRPSLKHLRLQARRLRVAFREGDAEAVERLRQHVARLQEAPADDLPDEVTTSEAQLAIAREYGFSGWRALKAHVDALSESAVPGADANNAFSHEELVTYFAAVRDGDLAALRSSLETNPTLTEARIEESGESLQGEAFEEVLRRPPTNRSRTAIHLAAKRYLGRDDDPPRNVEVVRLLLEHGADLNAIGFDGNCPDSAPITVAAWEGGIETMRPLLEAGADVSGEQGIRALSTAASHDAIDRFDLLLEYGAQASPWMLVKAGLDDRVIDLVDADPRLLTARNEDGTTLLQAAAQRMKYDGFERLPAAGRRIAEALIDRDAEVDVFSAAALNDIDRLRLLLESDLAPIRKTVGDDPHDDGPDDNTAVNMAVQARSFDALRVLLEAGFDPEVEALRWAARMDYTDACRLLLEHGAVVNDEVILAAAWRNEDPECLGLMLQHGGNPNANAGRGALHWVAARNPASVQLLLDAGADPDMCAPGATNNVPLHHAANNADSTSRLLTGGANPTLTNDNGDTPLDLPRATKRRMLSICCRAAWMRRRPSPAPTTRSRTRNSSTILPPSATEISTPCVHAWRPIRR